MPAAEGDAGQDPPVSKDLTHLIRDNQFQLELLEARISRLKQDLTPSGRKQKVKDARQPWSDPAQSLRVAQARLERLKEKLASRK
jgi:hypothetical protein